MGYREGKVTRELKSQKLRVTEGEGKSLTFLRLLRHKSVAGYHVGAVSSIN